MSKITRKSYKRKKILMGVSLFGAVGLVSTGFAAWVLSAQEVKSQDTSLKVGVVTDKGMEITIDSVKNTENAEQTISTFSFNPKASDTTGRVRYGQDAGNDAGPERLSLTVNATLTNADYLGLMTIETAVKSGGGTVGEGEGAKVGLAGAIELGYVVAPVSYDAAQVVYNSTANPKVTANSGFTITEPDSSSKNATFTYKVAFAWGDFFAGMNPSEFFDSSTAVSMANAAVPGTKKGSEFTGAEINQILTDLHTLLDGVVLTTTFTADAN